MIQEEEPDREQSWSDGRGFRERGSNGAEQVVRDETMRATRDNEAARRTERFRSRQLVISFVAVGGLGGELGGELGGRRYHSRDSFVNHSKRNRQRPRPYHSNVP